MSARTPDVMATCPNCGGLRVASLFPHAPRWVAGVLRDCAGREVAP